MKYDTLTTVADQIDSCIDLEMEENMRTEMTPHPVEFDMYYSCWSAAQAGVSPPNLKTGGKLPAFFVVVMSLRNIDPGGRVCLPWREGGLDHVVSPVAVRRACRLPLITNNADKGRNASLAAITYRRGDGPGRGAVFRC